MSGAARRPQDENPGEAPDEPLGEVFFEGFQGLRLAADAGGDPAAPSVVFLHGGGQTRHSWRRLAQDLATAGYRVVSYDARGHGGSGWSPDHVYNLDRLIADLCAVLARGRTPPVLIGASLGGITALAAIGERADLAVRGLVMVDVVPRLEAAGVANILRFMGANPQGFANLDEVADAVAKYNPHRPRPRDPSGLMRNLRRGEDGRLYWHWDPAFVTSEVRGERPQQGESRLERAATHVRIPVLLVRGMQSDVVSLESARAFQQSLPDCELVDVQGAGHMVAGDRNDVFREAIEAFLARVSPLPNRA